MGDMVAELSYGVMIRKEDFNRIWDLFYSPKGVEKKNKLTHYLGLRNPYETDDYIIYMQVSLRTAYNGTKALHDTFHIDYDVWDDEITPFLEEHKIKPLTEPNWLLTARFG